MSTKSIILQAISLLVIAGLVVAIVLMRNNQIKELANLPVPVTGVEAPASTPVPPGMEKAPNSIVTLSDGTKLELVAGTEIEVVSDGNGTKETVVRLLEGEMMVLPNPDTAEWLTVLTPKGYTARIQGCAMVVSYTPADDNFGLQCVSGQCEIGPSTDKFLIAEAGNYWLYKAGELQFPEPIDEAALLEKFSSAFQECVAMDPIPVTGGEVSATLDINAAATSACNDFESRFPGTPCP